jgi:tRNA(Glu) U13 pseudouridine synthase TruD
MSAFKEMKASRLNRVIDGSIIKDAEGNATWYTGCVPLGLEDDKYWLSELQVYLRANFAEAFGATEEDIAAPMHGRNKPIALGQVGIRCMHCKSKCRVQVLCFYELPRMVC